MRLVRRKNPLALARCGTVARNYNREAWLERRYHSCVVKNALGVSSVWINQVKDTCSDPAVRAVLTEFGVPEDHVVFGIAALGYAAGDPRPADKKYPVTIVE